ncbi:unnamed protein product [Cylicostephanus goldi]|uniref:Uncharacterized protein n=1 Tax=Cylicostephanus goldi TaxID=71465 RepID=A0A3P6SMA3_CYLGO|nr:unnamed protein product [Cylicostephanus goldi]
MLRQLICLICFLVPFASTGATQLVPIRCGSSNSTTPEIPAWKASDNELNTYNDLLGEVLSVFLKSQEIAVRLVGF